MESQKNTKEDKELNKFICDPKYRMRVLQKMRKSEDQNYQSKIKVAQYKKDGLVKMRQQEIMRIENARWEKYADGQLMINRTEGKIKINNTDFPFSSIRKAEINIQSGARVITVESSHSKKNPSIGGAIAGGIIGGKNGAVIGGSLLSKTKTTGNSTSNTIPTCTHMGIIIDIDGFPSEVTLISSQIDQSSSKYSNAYNNAQNIIMKLREISKIPVPQSFIPVSEEESVKNIDKQIEEANEQLNFAINNKPKYKIPEIYRTEEQLYMTDDEYLCYLENEDKTRNDLNEKNIIATNGSGYMSIISFVLGILGILLTVFVIGIIPSIIGLITGIVSIVKNNPKKGLAISGIVLSGLSILLFVILLLSV